MVALEQAVAAPFATRQLADLGARVIKVERPGTGDFARGYDRSVLGQASYFVWLNRGKESVELDVKSADGQAALAALLARADVFVQNLAPGAAERLGLGADRAPRPPPAADLLLGLRLRAGRPLPPQEGLRPAGAVRGRAAFGHRHPGRAVQGGHFGRRHRRRDVRLQRGADRAVRAGAHRPRIQPRGVPAGRPGRVDEPALLLHRLRRAGRPAHRRPARVHLPVRPLPGRAGVPGPAERPRVGRALRAGAGPAGPGHRRAVRHQPGPGRPRRRADGDHRGRARRP